jgi:putative transposase
MFRGKNYKIKYNPKVHRRRSIRFKGYDYASQGLYFLTLCVEDRNSLFGTVLEGEILLNDSGKMIEKWYFELENKFPDIKCHEFVIMPDHFHCIIENTGFAMGKDARFTVEWADTQVCPYRDVESSNDILPPMYIVGEHKGSLLWKVVQWFKTMTTNAYIRGVKTLGWQPFNNTLWQRNYYEHIIRNENTYVTITNYIKNNPIKT